MKRIYGSCINYNNCLNADEKAELGIIEGHDFVCPECHQTLYDLKVTNEEKNPINMLLKIGVAVLSLVALFFMYKSCNKSNESSQNDESEKIEKTVANKNDDYFKIVENQVVKIGIQSLSPPFNYIENGKRTGFDYDFAKLIFSQSEFGLTNKNAVDADHEVMEYDEIPGLLAKKNARGDNDVDIIMGALSFDEKDTPGVIYTIPYMENFGYCLVAQKDSPIKTLDDLKGKKIGVLQGDPVLLDYVKSVLPAGATIVEKVVNTQLWESDFLKSKECDAIIFDFPFAAVEVENSDLQIKVSNLPNSSIAYRIGLRKGNEKLREELNTAIRKVKELPEYATLLKKYLPIKGVLAPTNKNNNPVYTVKRGETLSFIAQKYLGDLERWREIQALNNLPNPKFISIGDQLIMPADFN